MQAIDKHLEDRKVETPPVRILFFAGMFLLIFALSKHSWFFFVASFISIGTAIVLFFLNKRSAQTS